jgi:hypothetical protein
LNNLLDGVSLANFLSSSDRTGIQHEDDDDDAIHIDSDNEMVSSDDDDTTNDEDEWDNDENNNNRVVNNNHGMRAHPVVMQNQNQNRFGGFNPNFNQPAPRPAPKTVSDHIGVSLNDMKQTFPLSLKDQCRVRIKNCLVNYNPTNVDRLIILPDVLKRFILFQDEIDVILKLAETAKSK